ncbi:MAG: hypothetical protein LBD59_07960 [Prevotellaceae bacterium]|jgi:hypothetical protein|nr:hypothetical protein [Prevotellaceae bacterium]
MYDIHKKDSIGIIHIRQQIPTNSAGNIHIRQQIPTNSIGNGYIRQQIPTNSAGIIHIRQQVLSVVWLRNPSPAGSFFVVTAN